MKSKMRYNVSMYMILWLYLSHIIESKAKKKNDKIHVIDVISVFTRVWAVGLVYLSFSMLVWTRFSNI